MGRLDQYYEEAYKLYTVEKYLWNKLNLHKENQNGMRYKEYARVHDVILAEIDDLEVRVQELRRVNDA